MSLIIKKSNNTAPDEGNYTLELVGRSDVVQMTNNFDGEEKLVNKIYLEWVPVDFDYDPEVDSQDWNGVQFSTLMTVSLHKRSNLLPVVAALQGVKPDDIDGDVDLDALIGKRINATLSKTPGGYAKIDAATPVRRKKARKVTEEVFLADDDDEAA